MTTIQCCQPGQSPCGNCEHSPWGLRQAPGNGTM